MTWQPIETAPKDGTVIDLWLDDPKWSSEAERIPDAFWKEADPNYSWQYHPEPVDCFWAPGQGIDGAEAPMDNRLFTHWMPKPGAPE